MSTTGVLIEYHPSHAYPSYFPCSVADVLAAVLVRGNVLRLRVVVPVVLALGAGLAAALALVHAAETVVQPILSLGHLADQ